MSETVDTRWSEGNAPRDTPFPRHLMPIRGESLRRREPAAPDPCLTGLSVACNSTPQGRTSIDAYRPSTTTVDAISPLTKDGHSPNEDPCPFAVAHAFPVKRPAASDTNAESCVIEPDRLTLRAPPRCESDTTFARSALHERATADESLIGLTAELEFESKEIQLLLTALVRRQQGKLRDLFDEMAANRFEASVAIKDQRNTFAAQLESLREDARNERAQWDQERKSYQEAEAAKGCLIDCLQAELALKTDSLKTLTEQLTLTQARLEAANAKVAELVSAQEAFRRERRATPSAPRPVSTNEIIAKVMTPAKPPIKTVAAVLSGFKGNDRSRLEAAIVRLGGRVVACQPDELLPQFVTHVICNTLTPKVVAGLLKTGAHICPGEFVLRSLEAGHWISETTVRGLIGDAEAVRAAYPRVRVPPEAERDGGTAEVCAVLSKSGVELVTQTSTVLGVPELVHVLDELRPAFLTHQGAV